MKHATRVNVQMDLKGIDLDNFSDAELRRFEAGGALPLLTPTECDYVSHDGARIWYSSFGAWGPPVVLLHGGRRLPHKCIFKASEITDQRLLDRLALA